MSATRRYILHWHIFAFLLARNRGANCAACQQFLFLPAEIISHRKICLQEASKKSVFSSNFLPLEEVSASNQIICWQGALLARRGGMWPEEQNILLASSNYFSWQDLLARSWQEVISALPTSCHEKRFLLASKLFAGKQRCLQEGGGYMLKKSRAHLLPTSCKKIM